MRLGSSISSSLSIAALANSRLSAGSMRRSPSTMGQCPRQRRSSKTRFNTRDANMSAQFGSIGRRSSTVIMGRSSGTGLAMYCASDFIDRARLAPSAVRREGPWCRRPVANPSSHGRRTALRGSEDSLDGFPRAWRRVETRTDISTDRLATWAHRRLPAEGPHRTHASMRRGYAGLGRSAVGTCAVCEGP